jgi:hypothetical protein
MKVREKEPEDQPWIETILNERWGGGGQVVAHGEIFVAPFLLALVAGPDKWLLDEFGSIPCSPSIDKTLKI